MNGAALIQDADDFGPLVHGFGRKVGRCVLVRVRLRAGYRIRSSQRRRRTTLADECVKSRHEASAPEMKRSNWCSSGGCFDAQMAMSALSRKYRLMSEIVISSSASRACLSCSMVQSGSSCAQHRGHVPIASGVASVTCKRILNHLNILIIKLF